MPLIHLLARPGITLCGKRQWGLSDSEGAVTDLSLVNCKACLAKAPTDGKSALSVILPRIQKPVSWMAGCLQPHYDNQL